LFMASRFLDYEAAQPPTFAPDHVALLTLVKLSRMVQEDRYGFLGTASVCTLTHLCLDCSRNLVGWGTASPEKSFSINETVFLSIVALVSSDESPCSRRSFAWSTLCQVLADPHCEFARTCRDWFAENAKIWVALREILAVEPLHDHPELLQCAARFIGMDFS
jgi:hypothetical protein